MCLTVTDGGRKLKKQTTTSLGLRNSRVWNSRPNDKKQGKWDWGKLKWDKCDSTALPGICKSQEIRFLTCIQHREINIHHTHRKILNQITARLFTALHRSGVSGRRTKGISWMHPARREVEEDGSKWNEGVNELQAERCGIPLPCHILLYFHWDLAKISPMHPQTSTALVVQ